LLPRRELRRDPENIHNVVRHLGPIHTVFAIVLDLKREIGRIDFDCIVIVEVPNV